MMKIVLENLILYELDKIRENKTKPWHRKWQQKKTKYNYGMIDIRCTSEFNEMIE